MIQKFTNWAQVPLIMDLQVACVLLGRSYDSVKKSAQSGAFPAFKNGERKWAVNKDDLLTWMDEQKVKNK